MRAFLPGYDASNVVSGSQLIIPWQLPSFTRRMGGFLPVVYQFLSGIAGAPHQLTGQTMPEVPAGNRLPGCYACVARGTFFRRRNGMVKRIQVFVYVLGSYIVEKENSRVNENW